MAGFLVGFVGHDEAEQAVGTEELVIHLVEEGICSDRETLITTECRD